METSAKNFAPMANSSTLPTTNVSVPQEVTGLAANASSAPVVKSSSQALRLVNVPPELGGMDMDALGQTLASTAKNGMSSLSPASAPLVQPGMELTVSSPKPAEEASI